MRLTSDLEARSHRGHEEVHGVAREVVVVARGGKHLEVGGRGTAAAVGDAQLLPRRRQPASL